MSDHTTPAHVPEQDQVEYRAIPEWPGYQVGSDGSVWSPHARNGRLTGRWRRLASKSDHRRYHKVTLCRYPLRRDVSVHRLVLLAFVGPCPDGMECRHLDGDGSNNCLSNLCWGTKKENARDRRSHGRDTVGEGHGNSKLTEAQVRRIRARTAAGERVDAAMAAEYGIHLDSLRRIVARKAWTHVAAVAPLLDHEDARPAPEQPGLFPQEDA